LKNHLLEVPIQAFLQNMTSSLLPNLELPIG
jgi:hypothetical protein